MKHFFLTYKQYIIPLIIVLPLLYFFFRPQNEAPDLLQATFEEPQTFTNSQVQQQNIEQVSDPSFELQQAAVYVDVKGAVKHPGVYVMEPSMRIIDAIEQAGGYLDDANTTAINHAQKVADEMVIYVPRKGESQEEIEQLLGQVYISQGTSSQSSGASSGSASEKININQADQTTLTKLPGVGMQKAQAIIDYRNEFGPFKTIDDLKNVSGIGEKTFEKLQNLIDVNG